MDHTKEPWNVGTKVGRAIYGADCSVVAMCDSLYEASSDEANARRIVACVNALDHISTETLEGFNRSGIKLAATEGYAQILEQQRDQLLAALEKAVAQLVDSPNGEIIGSYDGDADLIAEMQAAIAAVKGGAQ